MNTNYKPGTFGYDVEFLKKKRNVIILSDKAKKSQILVSADFQGRVMTSTANGLEGKSFGWLNYKAIESDSIQKHINAYGGEDRFWLGPEGGQFSLFFKKGVAFDFDNWFTPKELDTEAFVLINKTATKAEFTKSMNLKNYSGTEFDITVNRNVSLIDASKAKEILDIDINDAVKFVGIETENNLINKGNNAWDKNSGTVSIWILGMFKPSDNTVIVVPFNAGDENKLGRIVNDEYFGKIPEDRLRIINNTIFFKGDGKQRGKIGLSSLRAKSFIGSYDSLNKVLTIVNYTLNNNNIEYVNSMWELQEYPFVGDAVNSYNDGPLEDGNQLGPFYELESSSPAAFLKTKEKITHFHRTFHFTGEEAELTKISMKVLGISLEDVKNAFK